MTKHLTAKSAENAEGNAAAQRELVSGIPIFLFSAFFAVN